MSPERKPVPGQYRFFPVLLALLLFSIPAFRGQHGSSPLMLHLKFRTGETNRYQRKVSLNQRIRQASRLQPMNITMKVTTRSLIQKKITKMVNGGSAEMTETVLSMEITQNGQALSGHPAPPLVITFDTTGKIQSVHGTNQRQAMSYVLGNVMNANLMVAMNTLPLQAVQPGDHWTATVPIPNMPGLETATVDSTFVKLEQVGRFQTARIHSIVKMPLGLMVDRSGQPTQQASNAYITLTGSSQATFDTNFAFTEGFAVRAVGSETIETDARYKDPSNNAQIRATVTASEQILR